MAPPPECLNDWLSKQATDHYSPTVNCSMFHLCQIHDGLTMASWWHHDGLMVASRWPHGGITMASWWHHDGLMVASRWHHGGITMASWWHHDGLMVASRWPHGGITMASWWHHDGLMVASRWPHGGITMASWWHHDGLTHHIWPQIQPRSPSHHECARREAVVRTSWGQRVYDVRLTQPVENLALYCTWYCLKHYDIFKTL